MKCTLLIFLAFFSSYLISQENDQRDGVFIQCIEGNLFTINYYDGVNKTYPKQEIVYDSIESSCKFSKYLYEIDIEVERKTEGGACGYATWINFGLAINGQQIISSAKFNNSCTSSIKSIKIATRSEHVTEITFCGDGHYGSTAVNGCVSIFTQDLLKLKDPVKRFNQDAISTLIDAGHAK